MRIALLGTRGVPARYGGFETCVEEVGKRLAARGHDVTVYCRRGTTPRQGDGSWPERYEGMSLVVLPAVPSRSLETLSHTGFSVLHLLGRRADAAFVFNAANAPFLPLIRAARVPVATHVDGLEWKRAKWSGFGKRYYRRAESMSVRWSDALIADAQGIADYYTAEFGAPTVQIAYGAPRIAPDSTRLAELGLTERGYHLVVARFEPENNVLPIVDGYRASRATLPLVVVGSAPYAGAYTERVHAAADDRVTFLGGVWDQELLDQLYANSFTYLHGHSVGGTNPSLLRAIGAGAPVIAFDTEFNREVLQGAGSYFSGPDGVTAAIEAAEGDTEETQRRGRESLGQAERYDWESIADSYEELARDLVDLRRRGARPSGRRTKAGAQ